MMTIDTTVRDTCAGVTFGTMVLPGARTAISAMLCGLKGGVVGELLSQWLTENLFDLPKTQAFEKCL